MDLNQRWWRIAIFCLVSGGAIWWLSSQVAPPEEAGNFSPRVKSGFTERKETSGRLVNVLGTQINRLLPDSVKEEINKVEERLVKKSAQVVEETEVVYQIKTTVEEILEGVNTFPEKQKREVKRKVIRQVCDELLEELEQ